MLDLVKKKKTATTVNGVKPSVERSVEDVQKRSKTKVHNAKGGIFKEAQGSVLRPLRFISRSYCGP